MTPNPTPGSPEAVKQGCTCPVIDNHHGRGFTVPRIPGLNFIITEKCPVHDAEVKDA